MLIPYSQQLADLLPLKIRSEGDPGGPTTAEDHRAFEALEIEAIAFLEAMARGNRIFVAELDGSPPGPDIEAIEGDLCLDRIGNGLPLWTWLDGEWIALGNLVGADGAKILGGVGVPDPATGTLGDWYFRYNVAAFEKTPGGWVNRFPLGAGGTTLPDQAGQAGKVLGTDGGVLSWVTGTSWETVKALVAGATAQVAGAFVVGDTLETFLGRLLYRVVNFGTNSIGAVAALSTTALADNISLSTALARLQGQLNANSPAFATLVPAAGTATITAAYRNLCNTILPLTAASTTLAIPTTNVPNGACGIVKVVQDSTGGRVLVMPAYSATHLGSSDVVIRTPASSVTDLSWIFDGTAFHWTFKQY